MSKVNAECSISSFYREKRNRTVLEERREGVCESVCVCV